MCIKLKKVCIKTTSSLYPLENESPIPVGKKINTTTHNIIMFCAISTGTSNKLCKHITHTQYIYIYISNNNPQSRYIIFMWKTFEREGKTMGPSPAKIFHYKIMSLHQFFLKQMLEATKTSRIHNSWFTTNIYHTLRWI